MTPWVIPGSFGDKKHALRFAAKCMGISYKEYLKLRKEKGNSFIDHIHAEMQEWEII